MSVEFWDIGLCGFIIRFVIGFRKKMQNIALKVVCLVTDR